MQRREIDSIEQLRAAAPAWDALWQRSEVAIPTARAELVAQWLERFAPRSLLRIVVVEQGERMVAALPLVGRRLRGVLPVGGLTGNVWSPNGELLLDPAAERDEVIGLLIDAVDEIPWWLIWSEMVPVETPRWQAMTAAAGRRGLAVDVRPRWRIGQVEIGSGSGGSGGDFQDYLAGRSKNLRRSLHKDLSRLERDGRVELRTFRAFTPHEVDERLREVFELEDRGWKGDAGSSVLRTPGMFEFYRRQARQLAEWGNLRVAVLVHRDKPIAFELGWTAKGVYHSYKVGYDPAYRSYGPGHLLRSHIIQSLFDEPDHHLVDFQGPQTEALLAWSTRSYPIARLAIAPRRPTSRAALGAYRLLKGRG